MPIINGKYVCKISEIYDTKEGINALKEEIRKAKNIRLQNIPENLMNELLPLLKGKKIRMILPPGSKPSEKLLEFSEVGIASPKADIYNVYKGKKIYPAGIFLPKIFFNVISINGDVFQISSMEYQKCIKCMNQTFEFAWRRSKKAK